MPYYSDSPVPIRPEHTRPVAAAQSNNQELSTLDKVEEIGLLAVHGAWEHIKNDKTSIAVKAVEGIAIGAAIMTAPAWIGVAAGVAGVGLLGKELYDKGKHVLPALEIVWDDKKPQNKLEEYRRQLAKETVSKELGSAIVDSAVMVGSGMAAGRIAGALKPGLTVKPKELTEVDHNQIAIDAMGGSSGGGAMAAAFAMGTPPEAIDTGKPADAPADAPATPDKAEQPATTPPALVQEKELPAP